MVSHLILTISMSVMRNNSSTIISKMKMKQCVVMQEEEDKMEETTITTEATGTMEVKVTTATTEAAVTTTIMDGPFRGASKSTEAVIVGEPYVTTTSEKTKRVSRAEKWAKITKDNVQCTTRKEAAEKYGSIILTAMATKVDSFSANIMDRETTIAVTTKMFSCNVEVTASQTIPLKRD